MLVGLIAASTGTHHMMMMTFITQGGEGQRKTNKKRKATKSKGRSLEEVSARGLVDYYPSGLIFTPRIFTFSALFRVCAESDAFSLTKQWAASAVRLGRDFRVSCRRDYMERFWQNRIDFQEDRIAHSILGMVLAAIC